MPKTLSASSASRSTSQPLPVRVVHDEGTAGLEMCLHVAKCLLGEQEALEPDAGIARMKRQRIDKCIHDQIIFRLALAEEPAAVSRDGRSPGGRCTACWDDRDVRAR